MTSRSNRAFVTLLSMLFLFMHVVRPAYAGMIGASDLLTDNGQMSRMSAMEIGDLRRQVADLLTAHGVPAETASRRAGMLTRSELSLLQQKFDELPAGQGVLSVLGILFLVLLILELVGVTNVFNRI